MIHFLVLLASTDGLNFCGNSWEEANTACAEPCQSHMDCIAEEKCFSNCTGCIDAEDCTHYRVTLSSSCGDKYFETDSLYVNSGTFSGENMYRSLDGTGVMYWNPNLHSEFGPTWAIGPSSKFPSSLPTNYVNNGCNVSSPDLARRVCGDWSCYNSTSAPPTLTKDPMISVKCVRRGLCKTIQVLIPPSFTLTGLWVGTYNLSGLHNGRPYYHILSGPMVFHYDMSHEMRMYWDPAPTPAPFCGCKTDSSPLCLNPGNCSVAKCDPSNPCPDKSPTLCCHWDPAGFVTTRPSWNVKWSFGHSYAEVHYGGIHIESSSLTPDLASITGVTAWKYISSSGGPTGKGGYKGRNYDVRCIDPSPTPVPSEAVCNMTPATQICRHGCASWGDLARDGNTMDQDKVNAMFLFGQSPNTNCCATPYWHSGAPMSSDSNFQGAWCYCKDSNDSTWAYCHPPDTAAEIYPDWH